MRNGLAALALTCAALFTTGANAGLLGDTVNGTYFFPNLATTFSNQGNQIVSPSASFTFLTGVPNTTVTVSDTSIVTTFDAAGSFTAATFNGFVITDLTNSLINSVIMNGLTNVPGFVAADISFTANSISVNLQGLTLTNASQQIVLDVGTRASAVPEPSTLALLGIGALGVFAFGGRRRQKSAP